jgi:hypothetical protein
VTNENAFDKEPYKGRGKTLQEAIDKAWDNSPKKGTGEETVLYVDQISVTGNNPPSWYRVILSDTP